MISSICGAILIHRDFSLAKAAAHWSDFPQSKRARIYAASMQNMRTKSGKAAG